MMEYKCFTTFWQDFSIADTFGVAAIKDTYNRAFNKWKHDYKYLTELVMVLNWKCWRHFEEKNTKLSDLYITLYYQTDNYAINHLKDDELNYYIQTTD